MCAHVCRRPMFTTKYSQPKTLTEGKEPMKRFLAWALLNLFHFLSSCDPHWILGCWEETSQTLEAGIGQT